MKTSDLYKLLFNNQADLEAFAARLIKSELLPRSITTIDKAVVILVKGISLDLEPLEAFRGIQVINGTPGISPQLGLALALRSGKLVDWELADDGETATVTLIRQGMKPKSATFSMADARAYKTKEYGKDTTLDQKYNWKSQPRVMRQWRAFAAALRLVFPDVMAGMYFAEELNPDADMAEAPDLAEVMSRPPAQAQLPEPAPAGQPALTDNGKTEPIQMAQVPESVLVPAAQAAQAIQGNPRIAVAFKEQIQAAEAAEAEPAPQPSKPAQAQAQPERPLNPEQLRDALFIKASDARFYGTARLGLAEAQAIEKQVTDAFEIAMIGQSESMGGRIMEYLTRGLYKRPGALPVPFLLGFRDWLRPQKGDSGEWFPSSMDAIRELELIIRMLDQG